MSPRLSSAVLAVTLALAGGANAQTPEQFYKGKQINLIVPSAGGGIFELSSRLVARHMPRYMAGNPAMVVQTQPGTGGIALANRFGAGVDKDGLTIAFMSRAMPQFPMIGDPNAHFDPLKFTWLGSLSNYANDAYMFAINADYPVRSVDDLRKPGPAMPVGANRTGSATLTFALILRDVLKLNIQVVRGFPGAAEVGLAMQRKEVQGVASDISFFASGMADQWFGKKLRPLVQFGRITRMAEFPEVPTGREVAAEGEDRALVEFAEMPFFMAMPFAAPVGIPADRAKALQDAFMATMRDGEFLADAKKMNLDVSAIDGAAIVKLIADTMKTPQPVLERFKGIVGG